MTEVERASAVELTTASVPASWLTPRMARQEPVHRWFVFPHSYSPALVRHLFERLDVGEGDTVLDPFCGAGTTLLEAAGAGMVPVGVDLLPISVLAARAKLNRPKLSKLTEAAEEAVAVAAVAEPVNPPSELLRRAFEPAVFGRLAAALESAGSDRAGRCVRLGVASACRSLSALVADGGWLRSVTPVTAEGGAVAALGDRFAAMAEDLESSRGRTSGRVFEADARALPLPSDSVQAVITSPPYPNRHDYTRVFAVELELLFGLGQRVKDLRYSAMRSHPEAQSPEVGSDYTEPADVARVVGQVAADHQDPRIARMLRGYFEDSYLVLRELRRVLVAGGKAALVVGNASYCGHSIDVDLRLADLAEAAGMEVDGVELLRLRGNSAQQMGLHGRKPSRESAVLLRRP